MIRVVLDALLAFLIPFALYAGWLALGRRNPLRRIHWPARHILPLAASGLGCVILSFVLFGLFAEGSVGAFVPAHMENGRVVPGRFR